VTAAVTGISRSLVSCHDCSLLVHAPPGDAHHESTCPRCHAPLHARKPNSIARTWALLIAAAVLYIPANAFPITHITSLGSVQSDTILSGVIFLIHHGMAPIAAVIFIASVAVPFLKMGVIVYLLLSVQRRSTRRMLDRTRMYRITELVGRWSMIDIFVVTILVALVQLGALATIDAGVGAVYFAGVVVLTMFAAESFDPRLIWDASEVGNE
jgi:paraquat-inducible protein A